jgi:hypothetical protein
MFKKVAGEKTEFCRVHSQFLTVMHGQNCPSAGALICASIRLADTKTSINYPLKVQ